MANEKSWIGCKEIAQLLNCTQRNVINLIRKGTISAKKDDNGKYFVQKSEFFRVFPECMEVEVVGSEKKPPRKENVSLLETKIQHLQEMMEEKSKQNQFLMDQLEVFTQEKSKMLDAITSHTKLLEYQGTGRVISSKRNSESTDNRIRWWSLKKKK